MGGALRPTPPQRARPPLHLHIFSRQRLCVPGVERRPDLITRCMCKGNCAVRVEAQVGRTGRDLAGMRDESVPSREQMQESQER
ncbi:hypothetical protein E2C01_089247 [Portunus trituberculatus]|uniref:Uncharacterized protein n=1 Tax=Portunus trituberculatus TaxID=210409 RepID=A0A5B7JHM3_PORTR|nr:hypothetical protein [Portunus trituberculatus]